MNAMNFLFSTENIILLATITLPILIICTAYQWYVIVSYRKRNIQLREHTAELGILNKTQQEQITAYNDKITSLTDKINSLSKQLADAEQAKQLAIQRAEHEREKVKDWQHIQQEMQKAADAAILNTGQKLSTKLLEDHKRETKAILDIFHNDRKKEQQQIQEYINKLGERLSNTEQLSLETKRQNDILWRTFTSPTSTGQLAELGLENLLRNMGLIAGSDFIMQHTINNSASDMHSHHLRPDCIIKLPNNRIVIIDCKASKHVLAIAEAEAEHNSDNRQIAQQKFIATMKDHLKALSRKDYATALQNSEFIKKHDIRNAHIINVMYIPSSAAVEMLHKLDPDLVNKSEKQGIIIVGPGMLHGLIYLISREISDERKLQNQELITREVERLLAALASTFNHIRNVGNSIKTLTNNFSKISGSYNKQVAPKIRNLQKLGIKTSGNKQLPNKLDSYELHNTHDTIELAAEYNSNSPHDNIARDDTTKHNIESLEPTAMPAATETINKENA